MLKPHEMPKNDLHRLLKRQLKKFAVNPEDPAINADFFNAVSDAYNSFNKDYQHIENILDQSSRELYLANKKLEYERDHTKTQLENIVDNVGGVIFETDLNGNFIFLNKAWESYSGFSIEKSIGKNYRNFLTPENVLGKEEFRKLFSREKKHIKFIFKFNKKNKLMWFEVKSKLIYCSKGFPCGFIGTVIDVTNLKNIEIKLNKASKSKDEFLSTMSHEIRTPLNAVTGLSNILLMDDYLPEQAENLKALKYSSEHLLGLINDLLDFDKIKSGKIKLVEKNFSLKYLLENIKSHFKISTEKKGLDFQLITAKNMPENIVGDKLKLTQIIKNLLSNSLKFTDKGSITLSVKNLGIFKNKVKLEFKVTDTGIGISKNRQEVIFESFVQANSQTSIKYGGSGLGLSISKKLLNLQNSDLKVKSELGKGSIFSFIIDFEVSHKLNIYEPEMIKMQPSFKPIKLKVLVAEDNKMNVLILKQFFVKWNIEYQLAENGQEALQIFKNEDFDVILMDLQMPILDGYQATKIIRNLPNYKSQIPIIALTAFAQTDIKKKTKSYKMDGFMGKPFDPIKLYNLLKSYSKTN